MANTTGITPNETVRADRKPIDKLERIQMERDWDNELKAIAAKRKAEELNNPKKGVLQTFKDKVMGTDEQNQAAKERMRKMDEKNPDSAQAKVNKALGMKSGGKVKDPTMTYQTYSKTGKPSGMKTVTVKKASGGSVSSASKRGDGCAIKGKTKGRMV
jgi:hypothetical protein